MKCSILLCFILSEYGTIDINWNVFQIRSRQKGGEHENTETKNAAPTVHTGYHPVQHTPRTGICRRHQPDGHVSARMEETNGIWRAYSFNADTTGWDPYKDAWVVADSEYYFDQAGRCVKIYDPASKKCSVYSSKKMALVKKDICTLRN